MKMSDEQLNILNWFSLYANILQMMNYEMNVQQTSTDELMSALQEQNDKYLRTVIEQNKGIIERLEKVENYVKRRDNNEN